MSVVAFRGAHEAPKSVRSEMATMEFTADQIGAWRTPPFQRPIRINAKVEAIAEEIRESGGRSSCGVIPGVITIGNLVGDTAVYIVDGQHRLEAFRISGLKAFYADVRVCKFESMAEMAEEFVRLNSVIVRMRPDDVMRGLESSVPALAKIRRECKFVGYDQIRRSTSSPIVSMSMLLRAWQSAKTETPAYSGGISATVIAQSLTGDELESLLNFLQTADSAWGRDFEYARLWGGLNLTMCMWLWNRMVQDHGRDSAKKWAKLNIKQFRNGLMGLSADASYIEWLMGRKLGDRDRNPAYARIKKIFATRLADDFRGRIMFPSPTWSN